MISCKEASMLSVKKIEGKVNPKQRLTLWIHHKMCVLCRAFDKQSNWIARASRKISANEAFSNQEKDRMRSTLFGE